jgi:protein-disulfide isomerase
MSEPEEVPGDTPEEEAPERADAHQRVDGPVYVKDPPAWSYVLTPIALVLGSLIIAGTIWWTRDDSETPPAQQPSPTEAVSTVPPTAPAASMSGLLDTIRGYARQLGLNEGEFNQCINTQTNVQRINQDLQAGAALGVTGTPTFFVNNKKIVGSRSLAILNEVIDKELEGSPTSIDAYSPAIQQLAAMSPPAFAIMEQKPDTAGASIEGSPNARVIVAEFSDFQCPFCKQWTDQSMMQLRNRLGDDVALAFLHFPIVQIHPNAGNASLVAICAGQQGKFWEMHDLLFARQTEWANLK